MASIQKLSNIDRENFYEEIDKVISEENLHPVEASRFVCDCLTLGKFKRNWIDHGYSIYVESRDEILKIRTQNKLEQIFNKYLERGV